MFSRGVDLFDVAIPYGVSHVATFVANASDWIQGQIKVNGYRFTLKYHAITNDLKQYHLVGAK